MAFLENGSPVATKLGPIATLNTTIAGKAAVTSIFTIADTTRTWLLMPQLTAGTYNCVTSTGTATLFIYDTSNDLIQEIAVTSTAASTAIASNFNRIEIEASGALDISITPANAKITTAGGTMILERLSSGNFAATSGGTAGNYTPGQYAHVVVVGGGGGGGGKSPIGSGTTTSGAGGAGGVSASTTAFPLTGTYALTAGTGGASGTPGGSGSPGGVGTAGNASTGFSLTSNGGAGGNGASSGPGSAGAAGTPSGDNTTDIYRTATRSILQAGAGGDGGRYNPYYIGENAGTAGKVLVLRWTP